MRLTLDRVLFDAESPAEAVALLELLITVARDTHPHAVLTDPPYLLGGDNGPIDVWLASRNPLEASAFRTVLLQGSLIAAGARAEAASDSAWPRRWHLPGPIEIRVERRLDSDWRSRKLTLADAVDLLREPVHLVLENASRSSLSTPSGGRDEWCKLANAREPAWPDRDARWWRG